jgi:hypothetical protein
MSKAVLYRKKSKTKGFAKDPPLKEGGMAKP